MLSFELKGGTVAAEEFMKKTTIPTKAPSLGAVETLLTLPSTTSHAEMRPEERKALGIAHGLIRMLVGIEGTEDIIEDFENALR